MGFRNLVLTIHNWVVAFDGKLVALRNVQRNRSMLDTLVLCMGTTGPFRNHTTDVVYPAHRILLDTSSGSLSWKPTALKSLFNPLLLSPVICATQKNAEWNKVPPKFAGSVAPAAHMNRLRDAIGQSWANHYTLNERELKVCHNAPAVLAGRGLRFLVPDL